MSNTENTSSSRLARVLGPFTAAALVVGTIIGSGVFKKPATNAAYLPDSGLVAFVWIAAGLLILCGALAYAEVAVLFPRTGGNYVFLREGYGRLAGFLWVWVDFWIIRSGSIAALATIFTESLHDILRSEQIRLTLGLADDEVLGYWPQRIVTVVVILGLTGVNIRGVRWGGGLQVVVTAVKVLSLIGIAIIPVFLLGMTRNETPVTSFANLQPIWPEQWRLSLASGLGAAFLGVLWAYHGWQNIAPIAGEVRNPQRNLPLALLGGVLVVIALYLSVNLGYYLTLPGSEMASLKGTTVAAASANRWFGSIGVIIISAAIGLSVFGSLNGNLLVGPRQLFAMGVDGMAPRWLGEVHTKFGTPAASIGLLGLWSSALVVGVAAWPQEGYKKSHFDQLTDFAMFGAVIFETLAVLAIYRFRAILPNAERPYQCPGYPIIPALHVLLPGFILYNMFSEPDSRLEAVVGLGFISLGTLVFYAAGLHKAKPHEQP